MLSTLKKRDIINFSLGDLGINLNFQLLSFWLMYFYTDVFGINVLHVGGILLVSRLWDAVNDPIMGIIADRTRNKIGTYKPFIYWGAIPLHVIALRIHLDAARAASDARDERSRPCQHPPRTVTEAAHGRG